MTSTSLEEELADLPPSGKLIYYVLEQEGELTQSELITKTLLAPRTVRYGLTRLDEKGFLDTRQSFRDARQDIYSLPRSRRDQEE